MPNPIEAGVSHIMDIAETSAEKAFDAVQQVEDSAATLGHGLIDRGDEVADLGIEQGREMVREGFKILRAAMEAAVAPVAKAVEPIFGSDEA